VHAPTLAAFATPHMSVPPGGVANSLAQDDATSVAAGVPAFVLLRTDGQLMEPELQDARAARLQQRAASVSGKIKRITLGKATNTTSKYRCWWSLACHPSATSAARREPSAQG